MAKEKINPELFDASSCLEGLNMLKRRHRVLIEGSSRLSQAVGMLQKKLEEADLIRSEFNVVECREAFLDVLEELEEIAENRQNLYEATPLMPKIGILDQSTRDFEIKREFEMTLPALL